MSTYQKQFNARGRLIDKKRLNHLKLQTRSFHCEWCNNLADRQVLESMYSATDQYLTKHEAFGFCSRVCMKRHMKSMCAIEAEQRRRKFEDLPPMIGFVCKHCNHDVAFMDGKIIRDFHYDHFCSQDCKISSQVLEDSRNEGLYRSQIACSKRIIEEESKRLADFEERMRLLEERRARYADDMKKCNIVPKAAYVRSSSRFEYRPLELSFIFPKEHVE